MCHRNDDDSVSFNGIENIVRKMLQHGPAYACSNDLRSEWKFNYLIHRLMYRSNEGNADTGCFAFVIPRSLAKLLVGFG